MVLFSSTLYITCAFFNLFTCYLFLLGGTKRGNEGIERGKQVEREESEGAI
jgi:hypothetical protein